MQEFVQHLESLMSGQTTIVNLTPHEITVYDAAGESVLQVIPSSGMARAAQLFKISLAGFLKNLLGLSRPAQQLLNIFSFHYDLLLPLSLGAGNYIM